MPPLTAPVAKASAAPPANPQAASPQAASPQAAAPAALAIDERFAALAADFMSQVEAKLEAFRQEIATQLGLNVDPLHKDLHDLLDQPMQSAAVACGSNHEDREQAEVLLIRKGSGWGVWVRRRGPLGPAS
jgi:hypothetical protein